MSLRPLAQVSGCFAVAVEFVRGMRDFPHYEPSNSTDGPRLQDEYHLRGQVKRPVGFADHALTEQRARI